MFSDRLGKINTEKMEENFKKAILAGKMSKKEATTLVSKLEACAASIKAAIKDLPEEGTYFN